LKKEQEPIAGLSAITSRQPGKSPLLLFSKKKRLLYQFFGR